MLLLHTPTHRRTLPTQLLPVTSADGKLPCAATSAAQIWSGCIGKRRLDRALVQAQDPSIEVSNPQEA